MAGSSVSALRTDASSCRQSVCDYLCLLLSYKLKSTTQNHSSGQCRQQISKSYGRLYVDLPDHNSQPQPLFCIILPSQTRNKKGNKVSFQPV